MEFEGSFPEDAAEVDLLVRREVAEERGEVLADGGSWMGARSAAMKQPKPTP